MKKAIFPAVLVAAVLLFGCGKQMSYDDQDATRVNAANAIQKTSELTARVEELESQVEELQSRLDEIDNSN